MANMDEKTITAKITKITQETHDVKTFRFMPKNGEKFDFMPGQFVFIYASIGKERVRRAYSIASSPLHTDYIDLTLKLYPDGKLTPYFHNHVKIGDVFEISSPQGNFVYSEEKGKNITLISGGAGIVPMISISRYCTDKKLNTNINILYSCKYPEDIIYEKELERLAKINPFLKYYITITRTTENWEGRKGRIDAEMIKESIEMPLDNVYYLCGSLDFIRGIADILKNMGIERTKIKRDVWV